MNSCWCCKFIACIMGFKGTGIAASSLATAVQSSVGLVSSGTGFATLTSIGMKGVFVTLLILVLFLQLLEEQLNISQNDSPLSPSF